MKTTLMALLMMISVSTLSTAATGQAEIKGTAADSKLSGTAYLQDVSTGLQVNVFLSGVPAGQHGFHIHEYGSCADLGKAAGSHYNPLSAPHGQILHEGMGHAHAGDLGNLTAGPDGKATLQAVIPGLSLSGPGASAAGRAFIVHEKADDFSQPLGNAGGRIGCGPILLTGTPAAPVGPAPKK